MVRRRVPGLLVILFVTGALLGQAAAATLSFSTYLGGSGDEADDFLGGVVGVAVDTAGNVYVTGTTQSADFPTTPRPPRNKRCHPGATCLNNEFTGAPLCCTPGFGRHEDCVRLGIPLVCCMPQ